MPLSAYLGPRGACVAHALVCVTMDCSFAVHAVSADRVKEAAGRVDILVLCAAIAGKPYKLSPQVGGKDDCSTAPVVSPLLDRETVCHSEVSDIVVPYVHLVLHAQ